ncbi:MAG: fumarylacetoacetate hydrolase family protein [Myxococcota bacterium]
MEPVAPLPTLQLEGRAEPFTVRRIMCVAKNYAAHAREMGSDPSREPPTFFGKPLSSLHSGDGELAYPRETSQLHYEVELVLAIGRGAQGPIAPSDADGLVVGVGCGIDFTRRDLQQDAKRRGWPWDLAKGFRGAAPVSALVAAPHLPALGRISLEVNGVVKQESDLSHMIWNCQEVLAQLSRYDDLEPGDLVFTGTPAGVGEVRRNDHLVAAVENVGQLAVRIA